MKLFYYPGNASMAPHFVLEEIGRPFELEYVDRTHDRHKSPDYLALNPNGLIPVLIDGDLVLYEAAAICLHLADAHPEKRLAPELGTPERAQWSPQRLVRPAIQRAMKFDSPLFRSAYRWIYERSA